MTKSIIAAGALVLVLSGCNKRADTGKTDSAQWPVAFSQSTFTAITPTADGAAYAIGADSGLWYLRGAKAIKVEFPGLQDAEVFFIGLEITALSDGSAYARSPVQKSIWHLRGGSAQRVSE